MESTTMPKRLPELSRFELQCLRRLWGRGEASIREIHADIPNAPSYSTVRKIFERLEEKKAVTRVRLEGRAWIYRSTVARSAMVRKEIRRLIDSLFDGAGAPLVAHLADMDAISLEDLQDLETRLKPDEPPRGEKEIAE
jgi:predicted transcriptional regulator